VQAILGGTGAAACWAAAILCSSRAARAAGVGPTLAWVMLVGAVAAMVLVPFAGTHGLDGGTLGWLAVAGVGNVAGLGLQYGALRTGKIAVVGQITAAEGLVAAALAALAGERLAAITLALFVPVTAGVVLAAAGEEPAGRRSRGPAVLLSTGAAVLFGANLYALGQIGDHASVLWSVLPARVVGVACVTLPLALGGRLALPRPAWPLVAVAGLAEVLGVLSFAIGAEDGVSVTAVLSTQYAALAALLAFLVLAERLRRRQLLGVLLATAGLAGLAATR
jgi:drug/metabolite transporter (DMT)-like permease